MAEELEPVRPHVARLCELSGHSLAERGALDGIEEACRAIERLSDAGGIVFECALSIRHSLVRLRRVDDAQRHMIYASSVGEKIGQLRDYLELQRPRAAGPGG